MLRISKLTDYAIIILSRLVLDAERIASAAWLAEEIHLAVPTVSKILKILAEAELVISFRGQGGGYKLAKNAAEITIAEVVSAMEGKLAMTECCSPKNRCVLDSLCTVKENWRVINQLISSVLAGLTLHDMIRPLTENSMTLRGIPVTVKGMGHD
jgi:FeS assembly SUF system regulator